jgi:propanol-preferring alcohol dehydrogenase
MVFERPTAPLELSDVARPVPAPGQVLLRILACGVCRTDLHIVDGELSEPKLPLIPGHEIVGEVVELGPECSRLSQGQRVGVGWLGETCGICTFCRSGRENLCDRPTFTGYTCDGGYAEYAVASEQFCFPLPSNYADADAAPLMCAGLIGYRSLVMAGNAERLGIYGFGAAAHLISQIAQFQGRQLYAFTRPGDTQAQAFARELGVQWAGGSDELPPERLDAAIIYAPVGALVPAALQASAKGATIVCAGIHMSDIPRFSYDLLWGERVLRSVANLTRADGEEFLRLAPQAGVVSTVTIYPLEAANQALSDLRAGRLSGAAVLVP